MSPGCRPTLDTRVRFCGQGYQHPGALFEVYILYTSYMSRLRPRIYLRPRSSSAHSATLKPKRVHTGAAQVRMPQPTVRDRECTETTSRPRQGHARSGVQCAWMSSARRAGWMRALVVILVQRCRTKLRAAPFSEPTYADYASAPSPPPSRARSRSSAPAATAASSVPSDAISGASSPAESTAPLFET